MYMLHDWVQKYRDHFNEALPVFMLRDKTDDELIELIKQCLKSGKPYVPDDPDPEIDY